MVRNIKFIMLVLVFLGSIVSSFAFIPTFESNPFGLDDPTTYDIDTNVCQTIKNNFMIKTFNCLNEDIDGKNIEQKIEFTWNGGSTLTADFIFAYEGAIESGKVSVLRNVTETKTVWDKEITSGSITYDNVSDFYYNIDYQNPEYYRAYFKTNNNYTEQSYINYSVTGSSYTFNYENVTYNSEQVSYIVEKYVDISNQFNYEGFNLFGKGFRYYSIDNIEFTSGQKYSTKWVYTPQNSNKTGKFHIFGKPSSLTLDQAVSQGAYIYQDPWWNSSWNYKREITVTSDGNYTDHVFQVNLTSSNFDYSKTDGTDIRILNSAEDTELDYRRFLWNSSGTSELYLKSNLTNGSNTFYMYYNNSLASDTSDASLTLSSSLENNIKLYGGTGSDVGWSVYNDGTHTYVTGFTSSDGAGSNDVLILKLDSSLNIVERKVYGGTGNDVGWSVYNDGTHTYVTGSTSSEGAGSADVLILKLDSSLNIVERKVYGGTGSDVGWSVYNDGTHTYVTGSTSSEGAGSDDVLILKLDSSLNIVERKVYGGTGSDVGYSMYNDGTHTYVTGFTSSEGAGSNDVLILKLDSSLNIVERKVYGGTGSDIGRSVYNDGTHTYVTGFTSSEGAGSNDVLILKLDSSLNIVERKVYGGTGSDVGYSMYNDGTHTYVTGFTSSEGAGSNDVLILKLDSSLNIVERKVYGGTGSDIGYSMYNDGTHTYVTGFTSSEGAGSDDVLISKFPNDWSSNLANETTPPGFNYTTSALTLATSTSTLATSTRTLATSIRTLASSTQTLSTSNLNETNFTLSFEGSDSNLSISLASEQTNLEITNLQLSELSYLDLSDDGTNYGKTSTGFTSSESHIFNLTVVDDISDQTLILSRTELDGAFTVYVNGNSVGTSPAYASGTGDWIYEVYNVNNAYLNSGVNEINITASNGNGETIFIDYIGLGDRSNISNNVLSNSSWVIAYANISTTETLDTVLNLIKNESGSTILNTNAVATKTIGSYTHMYIYQLPNVNQNYSFGFQANTTTEATLTSSSNDPEVEIDSTNPVLNSVTLNLNSYIGESEEYLVNLTEKNVDYVTVNVNGTNYNLSLNSSNGNTHIYNLSFSYLTSGINSVIFTVYDLVGKTDTYNVNVDVSNITQNIGIWNFNPLFNYTNYISVGDTFSYNDHTFRIPVTISAIGTAYITDWNGSYNISDTNPVNINVTLENGTVRTFSNNTLNLSWLSDSFNNTISKINYVSYLIQNALGVEWENSGVSDTRLFYINSYNLTNIPKNISLQIPLRTTYNGNSSSIDIYECTDTLNWALKTCNQWTEITTDVFNQDLLTYHHWGNTPSDYPTVDTNSDGKKDVLRITINNVTSERMFKIEVDGANGETAWSVQETPSETVSSGGGGLAGNLLGSSTDTTNVTNTVTKTNTNSYISGFWEFTDVVFTWFGDLFGGAFDSLKPLFNGDPKNTILIILIAVMLVGIPLVSGGSSPKRRGVSSG